MSMFLKRKFHPVGQGLFCTERFSSKNDDEPTINIIYDCGTLNSQKLVDDAIAAEFGPAIEDGKVDIDIMFISHFHADHISGLDTLRKYCNIKEYVIPILTTERIAEAYIFNLIHNSAFANKIFASLANPNEHGVRQIGAKDNVIYPLPEIPHWLIKPYMPSSGNPDKIEGELKKVGLSILWDSFVKKDFATADNLIEQMGKEGMSKLRSAYKNVYGDNHKYMLTLYSGYYDPEEKVKECNALYCGDYVAKEKLDVDLLTTPLDGRWPMVGTLQVPHHGSKDNNCQDLYNVERHCVISYGDSNFKHPHIETINYILKSQKGKALDTLHLVNSGSEYHQQLTI